jgi:hypothetical protein
MVAMIRKSWSRIVLFLALLFTTVFAAYMTAAEAATAITYNIQDVWFQDTGQPFYISSITTQRDYSIVGVYVADKLIGTLRVPNTCNGSTCISATLSIARVNETVHVYVQVWPEGVKENWSKAVDRAAQIARNDPTVKKLVGEHFVVEGGVPSRINLSTGEVGGVVELTVRTPLPSPLTYSITVNLDDGKVVSVTPM